MPGKKESALNRSTTELFRHIADNMEYSTPPIVLFITGLIKWYFDSYNCAFGALNKAKRVYPELLQSDEVEKLSLGFLTALDGEFREEDLTVRDVGVFFYNKEDVRISVCK